MLGGHAGSEPALISVIVTPAMLVFRRTLCSFVTSNMLKSWPNESCGMEGHDAFEDHLPTAKVIINPCSVASFARLACGAVPYYSSNVNRNGVLGHVAGGQ